MLDQRIFDTVDNDGICIFESATNSMKQYLLIKLSEDNNKVRMLSDKTMMVILEGEFGEDE